MLRMKKASFDLASLIGQRPDVAKARCEEDGFIVEILRPGTIALKLDLNPNRVRLRVERNRVADFHQG